MRVRLHIFGWNHRARAPTQRAKFLAQLFFGNLAKIQVFRAIYRLSNISGAKIMAQKPSFWYKLKMPQKVYLEILARCYNSPADWNRELFTLSKHSEILVSTKKIRKFWIWVFCG